MRMENTVIVSSGVLDATFCISGYYRTKQTIKKEKKKIIDNYKMHCS